MAAYNNSATVCFIGAGGVNFGHGDHPWNHSKRVEMLENVEVVAIVDPILEKAKEALAVKKMSEHANVYRSCHVYENILDAIANENISAAFIGKYFPTRYIGPSMC